MTKSTDYHDYVFRDGKLVGEFEEMYRNSATVPWHQDKQETWIDVRLTRELLRDLGHYHEIHDLGCGTGHYLELIARDFLLTGGRSYGYDISPTACKLAKQLFPQSEFNALDLTIQHTTHNTQHTTHNTQHTTKPIHDSWHTMVRFSKTFLCH